MISEVYNRDCVEYMRGLPDGFFQLAVCDPPYGDAGQGFIDKRGRYGGRFDRYKKRDENGQIEEIEWDTAPGEDFFQELFRVSKNQIIWGANHFTMPPTKCFLVWRKLSITDAFSMTMAEYAWTSFDSVPKVFEAMPQRKKNDINFHPTAKPIELYSWIYRLYADKSGPVFDPMMGSKASRIAAYYAGIDYYGCEISEDYFRQGCDRFDLICRGVERIGNKEIIQQTLF